MLNVVKHLAWGVVAASGYALFVIGVGRGERFYLSVHGEPAEPRRDPLLISPLEMGREAETSPLTGVGQGDLE